MHSNYLNSVIRQLRDQQVRFAPRERQIEQADSAERLLNELDPKRTYTWKYVCHQVTNNGFDSNPDLKLTGEAARHDLRLFIEDLSNAARPIVAAAGERVLTVDELAREFHVSTKTVSRWRLAGLVSRRFLVGGRMRLGFLQSSVDRFTVENEKRIRRAAEFSQLTHEERERIIERARSLALAGGLPMDVVRRIVQETGRSVETIRDMIRQFDHSHPEMAIFPDNHGPLRSETNRKIYQQYRRGESAESLAKRFCRTRTGIYRIVNVTRAAQIMALPLNYMPNDGFSRIRSEKSDAKILGPLPETETVAKTARPPSSLPPYLASLYEVPLLTRKQEMHLFRKMNYLKYLASELRSTLDLHRPKRRVMDLIEKAYDDSVVAKNQIIRANLRLVVSIAKRRIGPADPFFDLVSDGNMSLMRAAEKFDYARGFRFSTYASWAIMKNFARTIPDERRRRDRFQTSPAEIFAATEDTRSDQYEQEAVQVQRESQVEKILGRLDERERQIVTSRFGLIHGQAPLTLKQVGATMGVTKERIRQIQGRAMDKLRRAAVMEQIDRPA